jgi:hypothetical protein
MSIIRFLVMCPAAEAPTPTGVVCRTEEIALLTGERFFRCRECGMVHSWTADGALTEPISGRDLLSGIQAMTTL